MTDQAPLGHPDRDPTKAADGLRERHQALISRGLAGEIVPDGECRQLMLDVAAAGTATPPGRERDRLRKILYHWVAVMAARGDLTSEIPSLSPYAAATAPEGGDGGAAAKPPADPASTPSQPGSIVGAHESVSGAQSLARPAARQDGSGPGVADGPRPHGTDSVQAATINPVLAQVVAGAARSAGSVLGWLAAAGSAKAGTKSSPASAPVPTPGTEDVEALARTRAVIRIGAMARQWQASREEARPGYLPSGKALTEASLYTDDDPDIAAMVAASHAEADRIQLRQRRRASLALFGLGVGVSVFCGLLLYLHYEKMGAAKRQADEVERTQLLAANSASLAAREEIEREVRRAVEALARNDLNPLKALLGRIAETDPGDLDRLSLRPAPIRPSGSDETKPATKIAADKATNAASPLPRAGTCDGFLWFGSPQNSRLADRGDPSRLTVGQTVAIDRPRDIWLRADRPSDSYDLGPIAGLVPAGSTVTIASPLQRYERASGQQYWAKVTVPRQFCTTVYVQYQGSDAERDKLLFALREIGVQTPPAQAIANAAGRAEVRYFWPEDQMMAEDIGDLLAPFSKNMKFQVVSLTNFPRKPSAGTLEVWIDLNR